MSDYIDREQYNRLKDISELQDIQPKLKEFLKVHKPRSTRTTSQNSSIHLYLAQVAEELDKQGHTMQDVVKAIKTAEIRPTMLSMKEVVWKPILKIATGKESTTKHDKNDVDVVYEAMNKWLGDSFQIHIPFPSQDRSLLEVTYDN